MEFSKKDLKNGMVVELMDSSKRMVLDGKLIDDNGYIGLNHYRENLTIENIGAITRLDDINKVYQSHGEYFSNIFDKLTLIWERGEEEKMKKEKEYTFKEAIANIKDGEEYECTNITRAIKGIENNAGDIIIKHASSINGEVHLSENTTKFKLKRKEREVDVKEAMKAFHKKGKTIKSESERLSGNIVNIFKPVKIDTNFYGVEDDIKITPAMFCNCKWYILD